MSAGFTFDADAITEALKNIYEKNFKPMTDIESSLFFKFWDKLNIATNIGLTQSGVNVEDEFRHALRYNNGVFAAFKTHRLQNDMAALLLDSNGVRRPFKEWVKDASPIADHQCYTWLKTEYVTAINRATHAANRKQFMSVSDILPNLEWRPSTAADPREMHRLFYGLILPAEHPFWLEHSPGDDWNCQCRLSATDADRTPEDQIPVSLRKAAEGLDNNPAKDGKLFSDSHPYIAKAYKGAEEAVEKHIKSIIEPFIVYKNYKNGGELIIYNGVDKAKPDYKALLTMGNSLAREGHKVQLTPSIHFKSERYKEIYGSLIGTKYERKCPDLKIDNSFYEYESFERPWRKSKVGNMLKHGFKQSDKIIIDNNKGCGDRYIKRLIHVQSKQVPVSEVWVYEKGAIRLLYKKQGGH